MAHPQAQPQIDLVPLLHRAAAHHQRGELREAEALYREVLALAPENFDALHLYGVLMQQRGHPVDALRLIGQALAVNARVPAAYSNFGLVLAVLERHDEALAAYERAIALKPDYAEAHNSRGNALRVLARPEDALASYDAALKHRPTYADALVNRGKCLVALKRSHEALANFERALAVAPQHAAALKERGHLLRERGCFEEALAAYDRALALTPDDAETHANRGLVLRELKRFNEAFLAYDRALALKPDHVDVVVARGNVFYEMRCFAEALAEYDRALQMRPDFAFGFNNRGNALHALGRHDEALDSFGRAIALNPDYSEAHNNRGNALLDLNRPAEALADYERAVANKPLAFALVNRGSALRYLGHHAEALASFDEAIALNPDLAEAHWNKALLNLALGNYADGWEGYEWRWRGATELVPRGFSQPQWRGEDLTAKTILLHAEQGYGDSIQFLRYLPPVKAKAARVVLELPESIAPLLGPHAEDVTVVTRGAPLPPFDLHCPLMSLARAFGTTADTIPANAPYLSVPAARLDAWRARLPRGERRRVGLVWSGKPSHKNDHNRTLALAQLAPLLALPAFDFVSLQREYRDADLAALSTVPVQRIDQALADFADTAAAIEQCDLVIAVDTAVAHLAGALGKPVWLLLSHIQDWRWLIKREDSPWYPSARLFRQPAIGDWDSVLDRVAAELANFAH